MPEFVRTPDERFDHLPDYPFDEHFLDWDGLRMHYVDEGSGPPVLLMHGQPNWSYLYRKIIPRLKDAGYRCIAADYIGFGKSDKVIDDNWYTIERHCQSIRFLIETLDLSDIRIVVHDWGGPIGLRQVVDMPDRFSRVFVLNTWLHHLTMPYSDGIRSYRARSGEYPPFTGDIPTAANAFGPGWAAPFPAAIYKAGPRRFPWLHPYARPIEGNAADQARCFKALPSLGLPFHFAFGDSDVVFQPSWGKAWSEMIPGATFSTFPGGHFVQEHAPNGLADLFIEKMAEG